MGGGTLDYTLLEGWDPLDALYMTIITMTTVGYGETRPLSDAGRVFTITLIVTSIVLAGYAVLTLAAFILEGEFYRMIQERRMDQRITKRRNHVLLCGAGRTGKHIAEEFHRTQTLFVIVERDPAVLEEVLHLGDVLYIQGDGTEDEDNVFIVLSARALNPTLRIIARVSAASGRLTYPGWDAAATP